MHVSICLVLAVVAAPADDATLKLLQQFRSEFVMISPIQGEDDKQKTLLPFQDFAMARYETTQDLYEAVIGANPSRWKGARNSVEMTSLADAEAFCEKVTTLLRDAKLIDADQVVRLPTKTEWEYCCRAGTTTQYHFGDDESDLGDYAWFSGNAAGNDPPVGAKKPNAWGLYDMHGYLAEWTLADKTTNGKPITAYVRGGSWKSPPEDCLSASAQKLAAAATDDAVGFRCVLGRVEKVDGE
ncbi:formylglycine-generating enzyme family protein [Blastopirellula sp. J2-11]|uniref:formylglycine-generating enzyme family protein n=1 Tax=Blastopirellula sp. J2-11 TaxID=2943192 RepID=UPI0021C669D9|nr:formylglycine-generating enzyme family protein [Blastopirellula sp. J2-11]UUO06759.1 formylglycine-generating enzyme family protein [Blastopirellula sp. J2-11]